MEIKILENGKILVKHNNTNYLIEKDLISGTFIENYFVFTDLYHYNNLEGFINSDENDRYFYNEYADLESALKDIQEEKED